MSSEVPTPPGAGRGEEGPRALEGRYRSGMMARFGGLFQMLGLGLLLRRLRFEDHSAENIRRAAERGPVVYVLHTRSILDWLALNVVLNRRRLPLARFTHGIHTTWLRPLPDLLRELFAGLQARWKQGRPPDPVASGWMAQAVSRGLTSALFMVGEVGESGGDPVAALVQAQAHARRPIQLVPVVVVWQRRPAPIRTQVGRFVLGSADEPGPLQKLLRVANRDVDALVQAGEPLDLQALLDRAPEEAVERKVRIARILLRRYLYRESRVVRGPGVRPYRWTRRLVLGSPEVRRLVHDEALATGRPEAEVRARVDRVLDKIAARLSWPWMRVGRLLTSLLWHRIYSGVDIRPEDLERIRAAMRAGTPILVPCHRSHLDYLLISSVLFEHDITVPHVVAGDNLSFWPLGAIFRRLGAFFVKRSFQGDRIFPVVFERYLHQLIRDGFPVEFFIEGGRSRTGKLLPAKLGVLGMVLDAAAVGREDREVTLLPIAVSYEQIAENQAYARELAGGKKEREDLGQVVKATRVLGKRYGRVYLRVGEPLPVSEVIGSERAVWTHMDREHRRERLERTGERLIHRIAQEMVILPTGLVALALLAHPRRGIRVAHLTARVQRFDTLLRDSGARPAVSLTFGGWAVAEALKRFEGEKWVKRLPDPGAEDILQIVDEHRLSLEYYKNGLLHFLAGLAMMASAIRAVGAEADPAEILRLFRFQAFLLRYELVLDPDHSLEEHAAEAQRRLVACGALEQTESGGLRIDDKERLGELSELVRSLLESYLLVLRGARQLQARDLPVAELSKRIREVGQGLLAVDELRRPESLSLPNLDHAVRAFREEGVLQLRSGGGGLQFDEAGHDRYTADLRLLLG